MSRESDLIANGIIPGIKKPSFLMQKYYIGKAPVILPLYTFAIKVGTGGDLSASLTGDEHFSLLKNIPDGRVIEGHFALIDGENTTADNIIAYYLYPSEREFILPEGWSILVDKEEGGKIIVDDEINKTIIIVEKEP